MMMSSMSILQDRLAESIQLQLDAAKEEQLLRDTIRKLGHYEPDSLLVMNDDAIRRTMSFLTPDEMAHADALCRRVRYANECIWDGLMTDLSCGHIEARSNKLRVLMYRKDPYMYSTTSTLGRSIRIGGLLGTPFATIPSKSGLNRSSSPSYSTSYLHRR
mmetsp:Transcript_36842/g.80246  ORF Transcript_36842/g.80246 Transcript_36842/m.80246 type:complete len:160 (+) Transcript_36842:202-681(+)